MATNEMPYWLVNMCTHALQCGHGYARLMQGVLIQFYVWKNKESCIQLPWKVMKMQATESHANEWLIKWNDRGWGQSYNMAVQFVAIYWTAINPFNSQLTRPKCMKALSILMGPVQNRKCQGEMNYWNIEYLVNTHKKLIIRNLLLTWQEPATQKWCIWSCFDELARITSSWNARITEYKP